MSQPLRIVDLFPSLLQPEGDHGNAVSIAARVRGYGGSAEVFTVHPGQDVPPADLYFLGGSEDVDLVACAEAVGTCKTLASAVDSGAVVLGVGAGFTVLCREFEDAEGRTHDGAGLLDVTMRWSTRAEGPVITWPNPDLGLPALSGYEFHHGRAERGSGVAALAAVELGTGDGAEPAHDGAISGRVVGTWLHGPLLPRNPAVADLLLGWLLPDVVAGGAGPDDVLADAVRARRMTEARLA
jgi:lipid II isoglutaminyl synthase (glutamine-hydrolysing)